MVIDADSILRKPFIPEELHLKLGTLPGAPAHSWTGLLHVHYSNLQRCTCNLTCAVCGAC